MSVILNHNYNQMEKFVLDSYYNELTSESLAVGLSRYESLKYLEFNLSENIFTKIYIFKIRQI